MKISVRLVIAGLALGCAHATLAQPAPERATLRGHVSTRAGKPLADTVIIVRRREPGGSGAFWGASVLSDARGDFAIEDAEEGEYEIGGEALGLFGAADSLLLYRLAAGSPRAQVKMEAPIKLSVQVLGPDGEPLKGQATHIASRYKSSDGVTHWRYDKADAPNSPLGLTLDVGASLFVSCSELGWGFMNCDVVPGGSSITRTLKLQPGGSLRLSATDAGSGQAIIGAVPTLRAPSPSDFEAAKISAPTNDPNDLGGQNMGDIANLFHWQARERHQETTADGSLTLANLRPGFYMVSLEREGFEEPASQMVRVEAGKETVCAFALKHAGSEAALVKQATDT